MFEATRPISTRPRPEAEARYYEAVAEAKAEAE